MKTSNKKILSLIVVLTMIFSMQIFVFADQTQEADGEYQYQVLDVASRIIAKYYKFETKSSYLMTAAFYEKLTNPDANLEDMLAKMMSSLDKHSSYLTKDDYQYWKNHTISGEFGGIGVSIMERGGRIIVLSPMEGSPAEAAGILPNDVIASVDGIDVLGKSAEYLQSLVAGEIGTTVNIGILRGDKNLSFNIERAVIRDDTVSLSIDDGIGVLKVTKFNKTTTDDTKKVLEEFDAQGISKIIVDIRNNPGGELSSVIDFCNLFIPKGTVASAHFLNENEDEVYYSTLETPKYTLALLVNGASASAAELFAAAVKDTEVGLIFGETTYGKGTMQMLIPFSYTGGALRLTVAEYYSAAGNKVNGIGVIPDQTVKNKTETRDVSYFADFDILKESRYGDDSQNVLALEQRLAFLGYDVGEVNTFFDEETKAALETYQTYRNLPVTGTINLDTALDINSIDFESLEFNVDEQYNTAHRYLKTGIIE